MAESSSCCSSASCCAAPCACTPEIPSNGNDIPKVSTTLTAADKWGAVKVRLGIGRDHYTISPGLYRVGTPNEDSPVMVTANYKLSFDTLRRELTGIDAWVLVLDTKGINVWCAAGKGTFGTEELVARIEQTGIADRVKHRAVILPQLGAPGVSAHQVRERTGFRIIYGPIRASDIPAFLKAGMKAEPAMRRVNFSLKDRMVLTPVELTYAFKTIAYILGTLAIASVLGIAVVSWYGVLPYLGAVVVGNAVVPALLPWLPGRAFALKGWSIGVAYAVAVSLATGADWRQALIYLAILPAISGYLAFKFTGSSTYTSHSGVTKETRFALPAFAILTAAGIVLACLPF